jgi:hypothetical protein
MKPQHGIFFYSRTLKVFCKSQSRIRSTSAAMIDSDSLIPAHSPASLLHSPGLRLAVSHEGVSQSCGSENRETIQIML